MISKTSLFFSAMLFAVSVLCNGYAKPLKSSATQSFSQLGPEQRRDKGAVYKNQQAKSRLRRHRDRPEAESDDDDSLQMVTIDLSALRPSLPGLVLYKYGELAPKLVQIDLEALNPQLQPHIIWPQFTSQMNDLGEGYYELDPQENIPFLGESLMPFNNKQFARMTTMQSANEEEMPDINDLAGGDIYDFLPGSFRNEEMMTLHNSLPLADEVIVPLDWEEVKTEETTKSGKNKKNVFLSEGWKPGGEPHPRTGGGDRPSSSGSRDLIRGNESPERVYPFGSNGWRPGKREQLEKPSIIHIVESEAEDDTSSSKKRNSYMKNDYVTSYQPIKTMAPAARNGKKQRKLRKPAQESWNLFRRHWGMPH